MWCFDGEAQLKQRGGLDRITITTDRTQEMLE